MARNNLQDIWKNQPVPQKSWQEVLEKAQKFHRKKVKQLVSLNVQMLLTLSAMAWIWWALDSWLWTTRLGLILIALDVGLFLIIYNRALSHFIKVKPQQHVKKYLVALQRMKSRFYWIYHWGSHFYLLILSIGLGLYLVEFTQRMLWYYGLLTYGLSLGWVFWNWIYLRPRIVRRRKSELKNQIENLKETLKDDYNEEE